MAREKKVNSVAQYWLEKGLLKTFFHEGETVSDWTCGRDEKGHLVFARVIPEHELTNVVTCDENATPGNGKIALDISIFDHTGTRHINAQYKHRVQAGSIGAGKSESWHLEASSVHIGAYPVDLTNGRLSLGIPARDDTFAQCVVEHTEHGFMSDLDFGLVMEENGNSEPLLHALNRIPVRITEIDRNP